MEVASIDTAFRVVAQWGELTGKPQDYVVRSTIDKTDIWIVDWHIFENSYKYQLRPNQRPGLCPIAWRRAVAEQEAQDAKLRKENAGKPITISQVVSFILDEVLEDKARDLASKRARPKSSNDP